MKSLLIDMKIFHLKSRGDCMDDVTIHATTLACENDREYGLKPTVISSISEGQIPSFIVNKKSVSIQQASVKIELIGQKLMEQQM